MPKARGWHKLTFHLSSLSLSRTEEGCAEPGLPIGDPSAPISSWLRLPAAQEMSDSSSRFTLLPEHSTTSDRSCHVGMCATGNVAMAISIVQNSIDFAPSMQKGGFFSPS